jgi:hypothetical protein
MSDSATARLELSSTIATSASVCGSERRVALSRRLRLCGDQFNSDFGLGYLRTDGSSRHARSAVLKAAANISRGATSVKGRSFNGRAPKPAYHRAARSFFASITISTPPTSALTRRQRNAAARRSCPPSPLPATVLSTASRANKNPGTAWRANRFVIAAGTASCSIAVGARL